MKAFQPSIVEVGRTETCQTTTNNGVREVDLIHRSTLLPLKNVSLEDINQMVDMFDVQARKSVTH